MRHHVFAVNFAGVMLMLAGMKGRVSGTHSWTPGRRAGGALGEAWAAGPGGLLRCALLHQCLDSPAQDPEASLRPSLAWWLQLTPEATPGLLSQHLPGCPGKATPRTTLHVCITVTD